MWNELGSMILVSAALALLEPKSHALRILAVCFFIAVVFVGTPGLALLGCAAALAYRGHRLALAVVLIVLVSLTLTLSSGQGRLLGIAESSWMAFHSFFRGVGLGQWTWHQAEAQRAVLAKISFAPWLEIAPYFGVAPSLPAHLLAEFGILGLLFWFVFLTAALLVSIQAKRRVVKVVCRLLFVFILLSVGTTPIQVFLFSKPAQVKDCSDLLDSIPSSATTLKKLEETCPQIRSLEFSGYLAELAGDIPGARERYLLWHQTYPKDVMPAFSLARIAARTGNREAVRHWSEIAKSGEPRRDMRAMQLQRLIDESTSEGRAELWKAYEKEPRPLR